MKDIMTLAREAGIEDAHFHTPHPGVVAQLARFATLVSNQALEDAAKRIESPLHNYADVIRKMKEGV